MANFEFLKEKFPALANYGTLAEKYCYSDPNSCLIKLGKMGESIVNLMYQYDRVEFPYDNKADKRINKLWQEGYIDNELTAMLHALRKVRNKATHEDYGSIEDCKNYLPVTHSIATWFYGVYGDYDFQPASFEIPKLEYTRIVTEAEKKAIAEKEDVQEKKLLKKENQIAKKAEPVAKEKRQEQAKRCAFMRPKTEAETRIIIDAQLRQAGWEADTENLRYSKGTRPKKKHNMAIAEWPTDSKVKKCGYADYALFVGEQMVGVIEAKAEHKDISTVIDYQCKEYSSCIREDDAPYTIGKWNEYSVPFTFATNGKPYVEQFKTKSGIWFQDLRDKCNAPKALQGWPSPDGIMDMLKADVEKADKELAEMPFDLLQNPDGLNLRDYQVRAIISAENAVVNGRKCVLLAMATGTGKTRTILGMIYRFLKTGRFRRILFLVDRNTLGEQAQDVFRDVKLEKLLTLDGIYNIKGLDEKLIDKETRIQIATVQGMVQRLFYAGIEEPKPTVTDFDLVIVDEAHRGYVLDKTMSEEEAYYRDQFDYQSKYRMVIEYFDSVKIALTATPALHTTQIFGEPAYKYTYRDGVIDGYLIDHDAPHNLKTKLNTEGIHFQKGDVIPVYNPVTGEIENSELIDDELNFDVDDFNKTVISESFNRTVLEEIAKDIDPSDKESGKTLIYAVNDAHADMVVAILKEIYGEMGIDTSAIMKITGSIENGDQKKIRAAVKRFQNEQYPSIVVTVDLLTTGVDVPSITKLVFLRRVKSRILYEQMLGRATRLCAEIHKNHFEIYDAVGMYEALEKVSTIKPVVADSNISMLDLLQCLKDNEDNSHDEVSHNIGQLVAKLQRKAKSITPKQEEHFKSMSGGKAITQYITDLRKMSVDKQRNQLINDEEIMKFLHEMNKGTGRKVIISEEKDTLISNERGYGKGMAPADYIEEFTEFIKIHRNDITALNVICTKPKELTRSSLKDLRLALDRAGFTVQQLNTAVSSLNNKNITADIISLIRRFSIGSPLVSHEEKVKHAIEMMSQKHNFTKIQENWIKQIEQYLINEPVINKDTFNEDLRFKKQGGFNRINKMLGNELETIVDEINNYMYEDKSNEGDITA